MIRVFIIVSSIAAIFTMNALSPRKLPAPATTGGKPMMETLAERHSTREFSDKEISDATLSSLLWAANGINRPDGHRTAPSALNKQEIDIYVFDKKGVWLYEAATNTLTPCVEGDHRSLLCGGQEFVTEAPLTLLLVANGDRFELTGPQANLMMAADAGIVCENINLFCSSAGLATVPRASMDTNAIVSLLGLPASHLPLLNNPVGY